jgi:acetate kinase
MEAAGVKKLLYHETGLKGLLGLSNDMRELEANSDRRLSWPSTISCIGSDFMPASARTPYHSNVTATAEELMIARHTLAVVSGHRPSAAP